MTNRIGVLKNRLDTSALITLNQGNIERREGKTLKYVVLNVNRNRACVLFCRFVISEI